MKTVFNTDISDRDDVEEGALSPEERLPQVKQMLLSLAAHIDPQQETIFGPTPAWGVGEVMAELAKVLAYARTGKY